MVRAEGFKLLVRLAEIVVRLCVLVPGENLVAEVAFVVGYVGADFGDEAEGLGLVEGDAVVAGASNGAKGRRGDGGGGDMAPVMEGAVEMARRKDGMGGSAKGTKGAGRDGRVGWCEADGGAGDRAARTGEVEPVMKDGGAEGVKEVAGGLAG